MKRLLTICIPTYNRKNILVPDIKRYLSISDQRFCIKISDNCSTDGTDLDILAIKDERIIYKRNEKNIGGIANGYYALFDSPSKYILCLLDKDTIDEKLLSHFLDYLEKNDVPYGYVDLSNKEGVLREEYYISGKDAILQTAYISKHPSGFIFKTELFNIEFRKKYFQSILYDFPFLLDVLAGSLGSKYDATVFYWPLIINANLRNNLSEKYHGTHTGTYTYNDNNIFYGKEQRIRCYRIYLNHMLDLEISITDKKEISVRLTETGLSWVSTTLRILFRHKQLCEHYHVTSRKVPFVEMVGNIFEILNTFRKISRGRLSPVFVGRQFCLLGIKAILRSAKLVTKEVFISPSDKPISA